ncbi:MAG TPA: hypothetical protein VM165_11985 [Planctomycetaceae bacterium]|nr:hypothetical protein [Planctomycetaceae bacterium]
MQGSQRTVGRIIAAWGLMTVACGFASAADNGVTLTSPGQGTTYPLAYKFTPGTFAHYEVTQKSVILSRYEQGQEKMNNESTTTKHFRVVTADAAGVAQLEPIIDRVKMAVTFNDVNKVEYDSADPGPAPRGFEAVAATIGKSTARIHLTPNGELTKVTALPDAPASLTALAAKADPSMNFLIPLPREAVGIGAVWKDRYQVPVVVGEGLSQPVTLQREFALTKVTGAVATITFQTKIITPMDNPQVQAQLLQRTPAGTIEFDLDRGLIVAQTTKASGEVVQAFGANTKMQASLETTERLIPQTAGVQPAALKQ